MLLRWIPLAVLAHARTGIQNEIESGFVAGRSGDVILMPKDLPHDSSITLLGEGHIESNLVPEKVSINEVRDIASQALGLPGHNNQAFVKGDMFNMPTLQTMIVVHGMGTDAIKSHGLSNLAAMTGNSPTMELEDLSYPRDPLALSVTLSSGVNPATHGIVAEKWQSQGKVEHALSDDLHYESANIADVLTQLFPESLALSVSGSWAESRAHAPHTTSANTNAYAFNKESKKFESSASASSARLPSQLLEWSFHVDNTDATELFARMKLHGGHVSFTSNGDYTVQADRSSSPVAFSAQDSTDMMLIAEIMYAKFLARKLSTNTKLQKLLSDDHPDTITLSFRGLDAVAQKYGLESKQYAAALKLYDSALPLICTSFTQQLSPSSSSHIGQLVLMGTPVLLNKKMIEEQMQHLALSVDMAYLPSLYLAQAHSDPAHACETLRMNLDADSSSNIKTVCYHELENVQPTDSVFLMTSETTTSSATNVTAAELKRFQIVLWFSLAFTFTIIAAVLSFCCMEYERDTLLFSKRRVKEPSRQ